MKCRYNIIDYAHDQVSDREKREIEDHLKICAECRQQLSEVRTLIDSLKTIQVPERDPEYWKGYQRKLAGRLENMRAGTGRAATRRFFHTQRILPRPAWVFAAALALLIVGMVIGRASVPDAHRVAERPVTQEAAPTFVARNGDTAAEVGGALNWMAEPSVGAGYLSTTDLEALTDEEADELADMLGIDLYGSEEIFEDGPMSGYFFDYGIYSELEDLSPQEIEGIDRWFELI